MPRSAAARPRRPSPPPERADTGDEGAVLSLRRLERRCPGSVEVDGVREDESGGRLDVLRREQLLDLALGPVVDPAVDEVSRFGRLLDEIDDVHPCAIIAREDVQEIGLEGVVGLTPQRVRHGEPEALAVRSLRSLPSALERQIERVEGRMKLVLRKGEVQCRSHVLLGLGSRSGPGHRQGRGDAVRRVEEVAGLLTQLLVEVEGERAVSIGGCFQISRSDRGVRIPLQLRGDDAACRARIAADDLLALLLRFPFRGRAAEHRHRKSEREQSKESHGHARTLEQVACLVAHARQDEQRPRKASLWIKKGASPSMISTPDEPLAACGETRFGAQWLLSDEP